MTYWWCPSCKQRFTCLEGIPKLYLEDGVRKQDKFLRDHFYNGVLGRYYQFMMPFLTLPARPFRISWRQWALYCGIVCCLSLMILDVVQLVLGEPWNGRDAVSVAALPFVCIVFVRCPYLLYVLMLAVPVKISLLASGFRPKKTFEEIHSALVNRFLETGRRLRILDICTGTCNSLYRHGWMKLNADYVGIDLSETMLMQGRGLMSGRQVPMDFVLGDAGQLPFQCRVFDIVLNYGGVNGLGDAKTSLAEMARVVKTGGLVVFLDEQLYGSASWIERMYFKLVLSSHNLIHRCPVELLPSELHKVDVHQVYEFYYLCSAVKK